MKGILIIAHGSREKATEDTFKKIVAGLKSKIGNVFLETAYLQFSEETLENGLDKLVERNVTEIKIIPYFLFSGVHIRETIPGIIKEYAANHPNIKITLENTFGEDDRLAEILAQQVCEVLE